MRTLNYNGQIWTVVSPLSVSGFAFQPATPDTQIVKFTTSASATYHTELPTGRKLEDLSDKELIMVLEGAIKQGK